MTPKFSLAHLTALELAPIELLRVAEKAGYDYFSPRLAVVTDTEAEYPLVHDKSRLLELISALNQSRVKVHDVELASLKPEKEPRSFEPMFEAAEAIGAKQVICQLPDPDRTRSLEKFEEICALAAQYSLMVSLEFTSWSATPDFKSAREMLLKANQSNAGVLVDMLHASRSGTNPADFSTVPASWFGFIHLCDAIGAPPTEQEAQIFTARHDRVPPGRGGIAVAGFLEHLPAVPCSLEIPNTKLKEAMGPEAYVTYCLKETRSFFDALHSGRDLPGELQAVAPSGHRSAE